MLHCNKFSYIFAMLVANIFLVYSIVSLTNRETCTQALYNACALIIYFDLYKKQAQERCY